MTALLGPRRMEDCLAEEERAAADGLRTEYEQCLAQSDCSQTNSDYSSDDDDVDGADDFNGRLLCDSFTPCYEGLELPSSEVSEWRPLRRMRPDAIFPWITHTVQRISSRVHSVSRRRLTCALEPERKRYILVARWVQDLQAWRWQA